MHRIISFGAVVSDNIIKIPGSLHKEVKPIMAEHNMIEDLEGHIHQRGNVQETGSMGNIR